MSSKLLPPDQGFFTEAIADAHDSHGRLVPALDQIPHIGKDQVPPGWMQWLLRNAGLERLMPFVDWDVLWAEGPAWLRLRGTPAASVIAAGWLGWDIQFEDGAAATRIYDHYHIHLPRVPSLAELERLIDVERIAKSTDSRFFRLVHGYDIRPVRSAHSRFAECMLGGFSGVMVRPDWPLLSFRVNEHLHVRLGSRAFASETLIVSARADRRREVMLGRSRLPARMKPGPIWSLSFSESTKAGRAASARASDAPARLAGVRSGHSRFADRQAVFVGLRPVLGAHPRLGGMRLGDRWRFAEWERLTRMPNRMPLDALAHVGADILVAADEVPVAGRVLPLNPGAEADAKGLMRLGMKTDLRNAPWSGLPWGGSWGEAPRAIATLETV